MWPHEYLRAPSWVKLPPAIPQNFKILLIHTPNHMKSNSSFEIKGLATTVTLPPQSNTSYQLPIIGIEVKNISSKPISIMTGTGKVLLSKGQKLFESPKGKYVIVDRLPLPDLINNFIDTYFPRWYTKCKFCRGVHFGVLIGVGIMGVIWRLAELPN